jgi:hypothetical protein
MRFVTVARVLTLATSLAAINHSSAAAAEQAPVTVQEAMASVDYLVGNWSCMHTVGKFSGKYTTTYSKVLDDKFLKQSYNFPSQTGERKEPAVTAEAVMGYMPSRQGWTRFFANSEGQSFAIRMIDTGNGWTWKYVTFFKRTTPETPEPDATFTKKSATEYSIDGPTYPQNGVTVTEHHVCHKM